MKVNNNKISRWRVDDFRTLLNFANAEVNSENWKKVLGHSLGPEALVSLTYKVSNGLKTEKMLAGNFPPDELENLAENEIAALKPPPQSLQEFSKMFQDKINKAIQKVEYHLPKIFGKKPSFKSTIFLQANIRKILSEMATKKSLNKEKYLLLKKISLAAGSELKRDALIFPGGNIVLNQGVEDAGKFLFFNLADLLEEIAESESYHEDLERWRPLYPTYNVRNDSIKSSSPLKLKICKCGCGRFFLQTSRRPKYFISDKDRKSFHNSQRIKSGKAAQDVKRYRKKHELYRKTGKGGDK